MKTHGGKRDGSGPKPIYDEPMRTVSVRLTTRMIEALKEKGNGSLAEGIRKLAAKLIPKKRK